MRVGKVEVRVNRDLYYYYFHSAGFILKKFLLYYKEETIIDILKKNTSRSVNKDCFDIFVRANSTNKLLMLLLYF